MFALVSRSRADPSLQYYCRLIDEATVGENFRIEHSHVPDCPNDEKIAGSSFRTTSGTCISVRNLDK